MAAWSKAQVYDRSPSEIAGSNPAGGLDVCLLWLFCVVRWKSLRRADRSSRGVLSTVVRRCVWSRDLMNEETMVRVGLQCQKKYLTVIAGVNFEAGVCLGVGLILPCVWLRLLSLILPRSSKVLSLTKLPFAWCWHPSVCTASCCCTFLTAVQVGWYEVWQGSTVTTLWQQTCADTPHFQLPGLIRKQMLSKRDLRLVRRCGVVWLDECFPTFRHFFLFQS